MAQFLAIRNQDERFRRAHRSVIEDGNFLQARLEELSQAGLDKKEDDPRAANRKHIKALKRILKISDTISFLLALSGVLFATWDYELFYNDDGTTSPFSNGRSNSGLLAMVTITTIALISLITVHSILSFRIEKLQNPAYKNVSFLRSRFSKFLIIEVFINGLHCPPGVEQVFEFTQLNIKFYYSASGIILCCMFIRSYLLFRCFAIYSKWTSDLAEECCKPENCEADTIFAMKAVLKEKPYTSLSILMLVTTAIFGLVVRNFERPVYFGLPTTIGGYQDYSYIWNGMWLVAISMTTVGYGDFFPKTQMGRLVIVVVSFWGVFLMSMMVVTLTVSSSFEQKESKAYDILFRLNAKDEIKSKAENVRKLACKVVLIKWRHQRKQIAMHDYLKERKKLMGKLTIDLIKFNDARGLLTDYDIAPEEHLRQLSEKIDRDFEDLKDILLSMVSLEKQLGEIEKSQNLMLSAFSDSITFTQNLHSRLITS